MLFHLILHRGGSIRTYPCKGTWGFHFMLHVLFHLTRHYWGGVIALNPKPVIVASIFFSIIPIMYNPYITLYNAIWYFLSYPNLNTTGYKFQDLGQATGRGARPLCRPWDSGHGSRRIPWQPQGGVLCQILGLYWDNGKENGNYYLGLGFRVTNCCKILVTTA